MMETSHLQCLVYEGTVNVCDSSYKPSLLPVFTIHTSVTPVSYYNIILIFQPLASFDSSKWALFFINTDQCKVCLSGKVIVFGRMSAISCGPLNSRGRTWTASSSGRMSMDALEYWWQLHSQAAMRLGPPHGGEDWGLAPASPLILIWPRSSYAASSLTLFMCEMESVTTVGAGIERGVHLKIFKLTLFSTVQPLKQGLWVMASWNPIQEHSAVTVSPSHFFDGHDHPK